MKKTEKQIKLSQEIQDQAQVRFLDSTICQYYQTVKKDGLSILLSNLQNLFGEYKQTLENFKNEISEYNNFINLFNVEKDVKLLEQTPIIKSLIEDNDKKFLIDLVKDINANEQYTHCKRFIRKIKEDLLFLILICFLKLHYKDN